MTTALTALAWVVVAWLIVGLISSVYALYRAWKDWR